MPSAASDRRGVVGLLMLLFAITYLDRVCISVAGPRMQEELGIDPVGWGWVTGMFTLAYCLFEIPTGMMGDRIGPRRVLTRIVVWWSAFTVLTGTMTSYYPLLITRFLFGAGEAGAFPNASIVVARWFPARQRATMSGVILMASQVGGAIAPLLVLPIQMRYGWRMSFYVFGVAGLLWAALWYGWFRDSPEEKRGSAGAGRARHDPRRRPRVSLAPRVAIHDRVGAARRGVLLHLRLQLLPDVVSHVPGTWPRFHRSHAAALGPAVRRRRIRQPGRRRRQRRHGAAARRQARPARDRRGVPRCRGGLHHGGDGHASIRCSPWCSSP